MIPTRILDKISYEGDCWIWTGALKSGYAWLWYDGKRRKGHRVTYFLTTGQEPPILHHTCKNRRCLNPDHLEPHENHESHMSLHTEDKAPRKACRHGHLYSEYGKTYIYKGRTYNRCRICARNAYYSWSDRTGREPRFARRTEVQPNGQTPTGTTPPLPRGATLQKGK